MRKIYVWGPVALGLAVACSGKALDDGREEPNGEGGDGDNTGGGDNAGDGDGDNTGGGGNGDGDNPGDGDGDNTGGGGNTAGGGGAGYGGSVSADSLPCEVLGAAGNECVAAHSTARLLNPDYEGPLFELCRGQALPVEGCNGETTDIFAAGLHTDAAAVDAFCVDQPCIVSKVYDQSGRSNDLAPSPPGSAKPTPGAGVGARTLPVTVNGQDAYGMLFRPTMGYRAGCTACTVDTPDGIPVGDEPETIYMVTSVQDLIDGCCFDYGNGEVTSNNDGNGTAEAVFFGMGVIWGTGSGDGPWVMADLENGLFPGWENGGFNNISTNTSLPHEFVTAILVGDTAEQNSGKGRFALYGGDATEGELSTMYDGIRPERPGYVPMMKQGSVILSIAGDNSDGDGGRFYEGVIARGAATKSTLDELQAAIVAAGYGR